MNFNKKLIFYNVKKKSFSIKKNEIKNGINVLQDFLLTKVDGGYKIYDRVCDHNGGRLISRPNEKNIVCPMHGWIFDPTKGKYTNCDVKKSPIKYREDSECLYFDMEQKEPEFTTQNSTINKKVDLIFINHACIIFKCDKVTFAIDPWVFGPAFLNGWWLKQKSPTNSIELLNNCDFIYLSHNHPDHLHDLTIRKLRNDMKYLVPRFQSQSVEKYVKSLNARNIEILDFGYEYNSNEFEIVLSPLKSGDFRDDSGLYFSVGSFTCLLAVDTNALNFFNLPKNITLLATSFAGGASGYPVCFDDYDKEKKSNIIEQNKKSLIIRNINLLNLTNPKHFLPYAGFFIEKLERDKDISLINKKIKISEYKKICQKKNINLINVEKINKYTFLGNKIVKSNIIEKKFKDLSASYYLKKQKTSFSKVNAADIKNYFCNSNFVSNLILIVQLTDDNFKKNYISFKVNFKNIITKVDFLKKDFIIDLKDLNKKNKANILFLKIRKDGFNKVINERLPWEDLSIGFQLRLRRYPDVYNYNFWHHFTNKYVHGTRGGGLNQCNYCDSILQSLNVL